MLHSTIMSAFNWYGFLIGGAMLIGVACAYFLSRTRGYYEDLVFVVFIICVPLAIIGARLYYIVFDENGWDYWTFRRIIGIDSGGLRGLAIYGGILAAMVGGVLVHFYLKKTKKNPLDRASILQLFDLFFIFIILGQAIGRWGNFVNQEAHGDIVTNNALKWFPIAVKLSDGAWVYATFFYESFFNVIGCGIMLWLYMGRRKSFDGFVFSFYGLWYGFVRLCIEAMRTDSLMSGSFRVSQIVSILFMIAGAAIIITHIIRAILLDKKVFIFVSQEKLSPEYFGYEESRLSLPKRVYEKSTKKVRRISTDLEFSDEADSDNKTDSNITD